MMHTPIHTDGLLGDHARRDAAESCPPLVSSRSGAMPGILEGVQAALRSEHCETRIVYSECATVQEHFTSRFAYFILHAAPITAVRQDKCLMKPTHVRLHWHRIGREPWELFDVTVQGIRLLASGRPGRLRRTSCWKGSSAPQWLAAFAARHRPADDEPIGAPLQHQY